MKQVFSSFDQKKNRISHMPDPIRSHIVSFLPMKEAMRSSILSRQWRYVCSSLSNLKFDQVDFEETKKRKRGDFRDFVDETLLSHNGSDIKRFSLTVKVGDTFISSRHLNSWISFAVKHNVQDFEISSYGDDIEKLPQCLFTSSTLTKLSLYSVVIKGPRNIKFPMLKSLALLEVTINDENLVNSLLSSSTCPVIEKLVMRLCSMAINTLSISIPTLKHLHLLDSNYPDINISNSVLRKLKYMCGKPPNLIYENLVSVVSAKLQFELDFSYYGGSMDSVSKCASKILVWLRNVEKLCLMSGFIEFLSRNHYLLAGVVPFSCCSLKHLDVDMFPTENQAQVIALLLRSYPHLQTLGILVVDIDDTTDLDVVEVGEFWKPKQLPAGDILNSLKTVDIEDFKGSDGELYLVRFLLDNAKVLENMNICYSKIEKKVVRCKKSVSEMLSTFTRVSPLVTISLS